MFPKFNNSHKRRGSKINDGLNVKWLKLDVDNEENDQDKENTRVQNIEPRENNKIDWIASIPKQQKTDLSRPGQIVWTRLGKTPFWPSMVFPAQLDGNPDMLRFFCKSDRRTQMKLENIFPFDGFGSFEKLKKSVDSTLKRDFNSAFNVTSKSWSRAVAEATFVMTKAEDERKDIFLTLLSLSHENTSKRTLLRRKNSIRNCVVNESTINEEINQIRLYFQKNQISVAKPSENLAIIEKNDEKANKSQSILKYINESLDTEQVGGVIKICIVCFSNFTEELIKCSGTCGGYLHEKCYKECLVQSSDERANEEHSTEVYCEDCVDQSKAYCFICKLNDSSESIVISCSVENCWRRYHRDCLKNWPQAKFDDANQELICPSHECHNCPSNPMKNGVAIRDKLSTCIKCPTAFHTHSSCIQAGSIILSESRHICIKHRQLRKKISNLNYCYICKSDCDLSHCETCPYSFHKSCLQPSSTRTICTACFNGQHPVYGDIAWVKLYTYPWWPAIIVPPHCIPANIVKINHSPHDICVCYFGNHEYSWVARETMHRFDEDNVALLSKNEKKLQYAIASAQKWLQQVKLMKDKCPSPYTKILENTIVAPATLWYDNENEASACNCKRTDFDPCGPGSDCVNRYLYSECNDNCPCGDKCRNKRLQQRNYPELNLKYLGCKGFGLMSAEDIPKCSIVIEYVGEIITSSEFKRRNDDKIRSNCYFMEYFNGMFIDGETKGNLSRFINHSCNPNCSFENWNVNGVTVVAIVASKNIPKGTEITCKYNWSREINCLCNDEKCSLSGIWQ